MTSTARATAPRRTRAATAALAGLCAAALLAAACGQAPAAPAGGRSTGTAAPPTGGSSSAAGSSTAGVGSASSSAAAPLSWSALPTTAQLWVERNIVGPAADPAQPGVLAACATGAVDVSRNGGQTWTSVSTSGVPAALTKVGYAVTGTASPTPPCESAVPDPSAAGTVYAEWEVGQVQYGAPPVYHAAAYTTDGGKTWNAVPPPTGFDPGGFGGFSVTSGGAVQAIYGPVAAAGSGPSSRSPAFALTQATAGGASWQAAALACPSGGPCLRWGPAPTATGSCAMNDHPQPIERSADGGATWTEAYDRNAADLANGCDLNEIAAVGPQEALLVGRGAGTAMPSVRVTTDGGATWTPVTLPPLPGGQSPAPQGVQVLPDGALLAVIGGESSGQSLDLLPAGATSWCSVPGVTLAGVATSAGSVEPVGGRLVWIQEDQQGSPTVKSAPLSSIRC